MRLEFPFMDYAFFIGRSSIFDRRASGVHEGVIFHATIPVLFPCPPSLLEWFGGVSGQGGEDFD
jgi:hypothetical protein